MARYHHGLKIALVKCYEVVFRIAYYMTGVFDNQETLVRVAKKDSWLVGKLWFLKREAYPGRAKN